MQTPLIVRSLGSGRHTLAGGDLTVRINGVLAGKFGRLKSDLSHAADTLNSAPGTIRRDTVDNSAGTDAAGKLTHETKVMTGQIEPFRFTERKVTSDRLPDFAPRTAWPLRPAAMAPRVIAPLPRQRLP